MSWKFGTIDFQEFGIHVSHTTGLLDLPKLALSGTDWLHEDGKEYWQPATKYEDREIQLNCWISARGSGDMPGYLSFKNKIEAFEDALKVQGKTTLTTPYIDIEGCSASKGIDVSKAARYVSHLQAGVFTLRVTVHGDTKFGVYPIYDRGSFQIKGALVTKTMKVHRILQGDNYATCTLETNQPLEVQMYDWINLNTNGVHTEPYYFMGMPEVRKISSNKFIYNIRLEHGSILLKKSQFLFEGESDFPIYANLNTIIDRVIENTNRFIPGKFIKGTVEWTENRNHLFKGESCFDVVKRLSMEYELEYDIRWITPGAYYTINVVPKIATEKAIVLEHGRGNGLYELHREKPNMESLVTVLYAFGSTKNLKPSYRNGKRRLTFSGNPITMNVDQYMVVEKTVFFDEIFPNRTAPVSGYKQILPDPADTEFQAIKEQFPNGMYRVQDTTLAGEFDINDMLLGGLTAKLRMKTGNLAGFEFEIKMYDHDNQYIWIIPFKDERGNIYPNEVLTIQSGDEYTLIDIDQPESYVGYAENLLENKAWEYIQEYSTPEYPYTGYLHPAFLATLTSRFEVGDRLTIIDTHLGVNDLYRISEFTYDPLIDQYQVRFSEHRILPKREQLEIRLKTAERATEFMNLEKGETIRKSIETSNELKNRLLDPDDDLQDMDRTVRNESIDPRMLAYDAGVPQFSLRNALAEANYEGDFNKVHIGAGHLIMHNYPEKTRQRYDIRKMKDNGQEYDPTREWVIPATTFDLESDSGYWIYAKIPLDEGQHEIELFVEQDHVEVKKQIDDRILYYKLGHISDQSSPRTVAMLWGNVKQPVASQSDLALITQPNHGFRVGSPIRHDGSRYIKARADNDENAQVCGIVSAVINEDQFRYISDGYLPGEWILGAEYFLSPHNAGEMIILRDPEVWAVGQVRMSLGFGTSKGLKVELDVGDVISDLPTVRLSGIWDREFEFCINAGYQEIYYPDRYAVYEYEILEAILECDSGAVHGVSIRINNVPVGGLDNISVSAMGVSVATGGNIVTEGDRVTLHTSTSFSGSPFVIAGKLKILRP